jgi:hypothetical protein
LVLSITAIGRLYARHGGVGNGSVRGESVGLHGRSPNCDGGPKRTLVMRQRTAD